MVGGAVLAAGAVGAFLAGVFGAGFFVVLVVRAGTVVGSSLGVVSSMGLTTLIPGFAVVGEGDSWGVLRVLEPHSGQKARIRLEASQV